MDKKISTLVCRYPTATSQVLKAAIMVDPRPNKLDGSDLAVAMIPLQVMGESNEIVSIFAGAAKGASYDDLVGHALFVLGEKEKKKK